MSLRRLLSLKVFYSHEMLLTTTFAEFIYRLCAQIPKCTFSYLTFMSEL